MSLVPVYLRNIPNVGITAAISNSSSGLAFHQISIKASKWRLQDPQGGEEIVPTHYLDVIVVGANPNKSKVYYASAYNPADTAIKAPDCWSDDGVAPAAKAGNKQAVSCAACPHNVWGSKVTPNGSQTKTCADSVRLAVVIADNPTGPAFALRVPAASLANMYAFFGDIASRGHEAEHFVVRLSFDDAADYAKIKFTAVAWVSEQQAGAIARVIGTPEVDKLLGKDVQSAPALPAPAPAPLAITQTAPAGPAAPNFEQGMFAVNSAAPEAAKPRSRAKAAKVTAPAEHVVPSFLGNKDVPNTSAPAASVKVVAPPTDSGLDDLIGKAMGV